MRNRYRIEVEWRFKHGHRDIATHRTTVRSNSELAARNWGIESVIRKFRDDEIEIVKARATILE